MCVCVNVSLLCRLCTPPTRQRQEDACSRISGDGVTFLPDFDCLKEDDDGELYCVFPWEDEYEGYASDAASASVAVGVVAGATLLGVANWGVVRV